MSHLIGLITQGHLYTVIHVCVCVCACARSVSFRWVAKCCIAVILCKERWTDNLCKVYVLMVRVRACWATVGL